MTKSVYFILSKLDNVKSCQSNGKWTARCPAHHDKKNSLSISEGSDGRVLLKCFAGCHTEDVMSCIGLSMSDLFEKKENTPQSYPTDRKRGSMKIIETYDYTDETGKLLYQVCRTDDKQFPQRTPEGNGGWIWGLNGQQPVLYKLSRLIEGVKGGYPILLVEGEKDVERLTGAAFHATTPPMGANKWKEHYNKYFRDADLIIIPDNDVPGQQHAEFIALQLKDITKRTRILNLPGLSEKGDVSDWLDGKGSANKLLDLIEQTKPFNPADVKTEVELSGYAQWEEENQTEEPALPSFPLDVLPKTVQEIVSAYAESVRAPVDIAAVQALSITSLALGPNWQIKAASFQRSSRLWTAIVAPPGSGKTPVMIAMMKPVERWEKQLRKRWEHQLNDWRSHKNEEGEDKRANRPVQSHAKTDDFNIDALVSTLSASPLGIILDIDELTQLAGLIEQTHTGGKGRSRGAFLSMWSGKPISVIRKNSDDLYVENPYVIVCGGTQPDTLGSLGITQGDGMAQRFLWCHPNQSEKALGYGPDVSLCIAKTWEDGIYNAFNNMVYTAFATPEAVAFGNETIISFNQRKIDMNKIGLFAFGAMYAKAPDHFHRLLACLHGMDCIFEGKAKEEVNLEVFQRAHKLTEYFLAHSKHCISSAMSGRSQEASFQALRAKDQKLCNALEKTLQIEGKEMVLSTSEWSKTLTKHSQLKTSAVQLGKALKRLSELPLPGLSIKRHSESRKKANFWKIGLSEY